MNAPGYVLHERGYDYLAEDCPGWLSIKCMSGGQATYETSRGRYAVDGMGYLLLNHGQRYTVAIESPTVVESFCVFFAPETVAEVLDALVTPLDRLLDEPAPRHGQPVGFVERVYPHDAVLTPRLRALRAASGPEREEGMAGLLGVLLRAHRQAGEARERMPAVRPAAQAELYRRLHLAHDFLRASLAEPVTLAQAAQVACLSPYHFLRQFQAAFGETPHQFLVRRRLERARGLLARTDWPVEEICLAVGWQSHGSFSTLFRRRFGIAPTEYRKSAILEKARGGSPW